MVMRKIQTVLCLVAAAFALYGCGSKRPTVNESTVEAPVVVDSAKRAEVKAYEDANKEFATVKEAAEMVLGQADPKMLATKYGYKSISSYAVYRLESYDTMLYKNCQPAKKVGKNVYADFPQPLRKGTSSYVAIADGVTIGVFNDKAYGNLLEQVANGGFRLVEQGYEEHYTNGQVDVYCYASRRTVRVTKSDNQ